MILFSQSFFPLLTTQFLGALNDNLYKSGILVAFTYGFFGVQSIGSENFVTIAGGVFILPFVIFSPFVGKYGDLLDKSLMIRYTKFLEALIACIASISLWLGDVYLFLLVLFLFGTQSAFFGPLKYSILTHHLPYRFLNSGNGVIVFTTFIAILTGTIIGNWIVFVEGGLFILSLFMLLVSIVGIWSAIFIPSAPPYRSVAIKSFFRVSLDGVSDIFSVLEDKRVFRVMLVNSWFWGVGGVLVSLLPTIAYSISSSHAVLVNVLFVNFVLGIGLGALSIRLMDFALVHVRYLLICLSLMGLLLLDLSFLLTFNVPQEGSLEEILTTRFFIRLSLDLFLLAAVGGFFCTPLYTFLQKVSENSKRSMVFATTNVINSLLIVLCSLFSSVLFSLDFSISTVILSFSLCSILSGFVAWIGLGSLHELGLSSD